MYIKQISVYLENCKGTLRAMTKTLADNGIDLLALSIADTASFGIVRLVVREAQIDQTVKCMKAEGFMVRTDDVVCVAVPNQPAGLDQVLEILDGADISVEYIYSFNFSLTDAALLILRLNDNQRATEVLAKGGIHLYNQEDIDKL